MSAEPILGMYRGSVANNSDPLNEARVTLLIPQVLGNAESAWAVPASPTNTVPPVGETLWVQFSGGDITKPVYSPLGIKALQDTVSSLPTGLDPLPPKEPTALTLSTVQYVTNEGSTLARVTAGWTPPTENQDGTNLTDLSHYVLQYSYDGTNWSGGQSTQDALVVLDGLHTGVDVTVRVQAVDTSSNVSLWATAHITSASSTTPPPVPSAPAVLGVLGGLRVTWDGKDNTGSAMPAIFSHVQVQRDTTSAFANPVVIGTLPRQDFLYDSIQNYANAYYYRLIAYSKVGIASAPSGSNSDTPKQALAQDILDGALTAAKIAVGAIDNTKLAANAVTATNIANGAVEAGKLAALAVGTTNIANNAVTGAQMADATIGSAKIINGAIGTAQIADAAINNAKIANLDAGKITTGSLDANRIAAGALDASKITAGTLTATQILAGSITGDRLAANTVTANQIAANTITANQMAAGTITAQSGVIASLDASKITVGRVDASQIDATNLQVASANVTGQFSAGQVAAGAINTQHLTVGTLTGNLVTNAGFEDVSKTGWTLTKSDSSGTTTSSKIEVGEGGAPARSGQGKAALGVLNTGSAKITSSVFPLVPNQTYMFRYWYSGSGHLRVTFEQSADKVTWTDSLAGVNDVTYNTASYIEDIAEVTASSTALWGRVTFENYNPGSYGLSTTAFSWLCVDDVLVMREGYGATDISGGGLRLYGPDGNLATEMTTDNAHAKFAGGAAAIDPKGVGTFNSLWTPQRPAGAASDDPTGQIWYQGSELSDLLWNMPWGFVTYERGWTKRPDSATVPGGYTTETGLLELTFTAVEGRMYRIHASSHFSFTGGGATPCFLGNYLRASGTTTSLNGCTTVTPNGASPTVTNTMLGRSYNQAYDGTGTLFNASVEALLVCSNDAGNLYSAGSALAPGDHRLLWTATKSGGTATGWFMQNVSPNVSSDFYVEDIGPAVHEGGVYNTGGAAVTATKTYTKTYNAAWSIRFGNAGSSTGTVYQGNYSSTWGQQKSMVGFGTQPYTDMGSTAKVSKVEIYLYNSHWYYNAGGTAHIGVHTQTNQPTSFGMVSSLNTSIANWPVGAGKWVTLPSSWNSSWNAAGPYRGITLGGDLNTTDKTYYGYFDGVGGTHPPQLRITYTK